MELVTSCTRCGGFVMPEAFRDIGVSTVGWHCLLCGETVDDVILQNRARPCLVVLADDDSNERHTSEDECEFGTNELDCQESVLD